MMKDHAPRATRRRHQKRRGTVAPPRSAEALPKQTYVGGSIMLETGARKAQLTHVANAHTDGDTWVYFADADVLCTGDTLNNLKRYQNI